MGKATTASREEVLEKAKVIIRIFEGLELKPYICKGGCLTIGYGHRIYSKEPPLNFTEDDAEKFLHSDVLLAYSNLRKVLKIELNSNQQAALVSLIFNIGFENFKESTLLKCINSGKLTQAADEFDRWVHAKGKVLKGLTRRRAYEKIVFTRNHEAH